MHPSQDGRLDALDEVLVAIRRVPRQTEYRRRLLAGLDLVGGPATIRALRAVDRSSSSAPSIGEVAAALALDPSTTSRVVDRCVGAGLLMREPHPGDRRRTHLSLSTEGRELLEGATRNRRALLSEVTSGWKPEDLERLLSLLQALRDGFDQLEHA